MHPPNKAIKAAEAYQSLIDAKVASKNNSSRPTNENSHFYFSRVRYLFECALKHQEEVLVFSGDNKNKVRKTLILQYCIYMPTLNSYFYNMEIIEFYMHYIARSITVN